MDEEIRKKLKKADFKNTRHRAAILTLLKKSEQPVTAENIYLELASSSNVSLSTVYRTLDCLVSNNIVSKLNISKKGKALFEYNNSEHRHYLVCVECSKVRAIDYCVLTEYEKEREIQTEYSIIGHRLDIYGYCPGCSKRGVSAT